MLLILHGGGVGTSDAAQCVARVWQWGGMIKGWVKSIQCIWVRGGGSLGDAALWIFLALAGHGRRVDQVFFRVGHVIWVSIDWVDGQEGHQ